MYLSGKKQTNQKHRNYFSLKFFMKKISFPIFLLLALFLFQSAHPTLEWGFFGHRKINRMAVFTLPPDMMIFYKKNIEYITDHGSMKQFDII